jgi:putative oxidoreductase
LEKNMTNQSLTHVLPTGTTTTTLSNGGVLGRILASERDIATTIVRLTLGLVMFPHAAQKVFGWFGGGGVAGTLAFFESIGIPALPGTLAIAIEFVATVGLLLGLGSRISAVGIAAIMLGAITSVHAANGFFMNWVGSQAGEGIEYHLLVLGLAALVAIRGGGAWSLDRLLAGRVKGH